MTPVLDVVHFANPVTVGGFAWTGNFTTVDLIAASTNALNGALLARRPDHYKQFTMVGGLLPDEQTAFVSDSGPLTGPVG
jgi:hypothetical protein